MAKVSVPFTAKAVLTYENGESETIRIEDGVYEGVMAFDLALQVQDSTPLGKDGLPVFSGTIPGPMFGGPKRVAGLTDELANMARQQVVVVHYE
jgi:hypothetical protein